MEQSTDETIAKIISYVGWLLLLAALSFYLYGITDAIIRTVNATKAAPAKYPEFLSATIGSIQALLLANMGVLLGISITKPDSGIARSLRLGGAGSRIAATSSPMELKQGIQLFALLIYILVLVACLITWIHKKFSDDSQLVVSVVSESSKMLAAVIISYITAIFARPALPPPAPPAPPAR